MNTAIITGSTKGIGKSTATLLTNQDFNVIVCSRNLQDVNRVIEEILSHNNQSQVIGFKCDVSNPSGVDNLVKQTIHKFGKIDVLINNAGIGVYKDIINTSNEEWFNTININLSGCFLFCKAVLPYMMKNNSGTIINISSGAGKMGFPKLSAYCASKFGIMGFSESIAKEVTSYDIRVMVLCPGEINTEMLNEIARSGFQLSNKKEYLYQPDDVASKILEMVQQKKTYRNGQIVEFYSGTRY